MALAQVLHAGVRVQVAVGVGVDKDMTKAAGLYRLAADQGDSVAQNDLGAHSSSGAGVAKGTHGAAKL